MNFNENMGMGIQFRFVGAARQWGAGLVFFLAGSGLFFIGFESDPPANFIIMGMGGFFGGIGFLALLLKVLKVSEATIDLIMGVLGAGSFSVPATFVFPAILYLYLTRPNFQYGADVTSLPTKDFWLGVLFSFLGLLVDVIIIWIIRRKGRPQTIKTRHGQITIGPGDPGMY